VWQAGGFPIEMPAIALAEPFQKPPPMMYRNFLAMETEELLPLVSRRRLRPLRAAATRRRPLW